MASTHSFAARISRTLTTALVVAILLFLALQVYALVVQRESRLPLPPLVGYFEPAKKALGEAVAKEEFRFLVIGDSRGATGVIERLWDKVQSSNPDFTVLLGDVFNSDDGTEPYFRAECATEFDMRTPLFLLVGNEDINPDTFPLSRFEETYGPRVFSFEYQDCLFVFLCTIGDKESDQASIALLEDLIEKDASQYRRRFVFMHVPPRMPGPDPKKFTALARIVPLLKQLGADLVFAAHYHGYQQITYEGIDFLVTGGGGAHLDTKGKVAQFYHGVLVTVGRDYIGRQVIPVAREYGLEDPLERFAICSVYPWLKRSPIVYGVDAALLAIAVGVLVRKKRHKKASKEIRAAREAEATPV